MTGHRSGRLQSWADALGYYMSMHKQPLTDLERSGLEKHHLPIGQPSQLSDCFRLGMQHALEAKGPPHWWSPSKEQFAAWCRRHDMREMDRPAFDDAATLYLLSFASLTQPNTNSGTHTVA